MYLYTGYLTGSAPIYDTGCSLFAALGMGYRDDILEKDYKARPFASTHDLQIRLVDTSKYSAELEYLRTKIDAIFYEEYLKVNMKEMYIKSLLDIVIPISNKLNTQPRTKNNTTNCAFRKGINSHTKRVNNFV